MSNANGVGLGGPRGSGPCALGLYDHKRFCCRTNEGQRTGWHHALGLIFSAFWKLVFKSELGGPADRDFIIYAFQDEVGLIPGFALQTGDVIQVDDMGAIDSGEGWKGQDLFVTAQGLADHEGG